MTGIYGTDYDETGRPVSDDGLIWMDQVRRQRISWLWRGRLPRGKLVVLDGDPGVGKSTLVIDWISRVTTGTPWPDGTPCPKGNAVIMSAEDGAEDTIGPRLDAAGADSARVALWTEVTEEEPGEKAGEVIRKTRPPVLPTDIEALARKIAITEAKIIMIDVLMAYLAGSVKSNSDQDVRRVLHQLARLAERTGCCIVLLRHLNKTGGASAIYRGGGSIGISGAARAVFIAAKDPDDESGKTRVLACVKINIAAEPDSLTYTLAQSDLHECAYIRWGKVIKRTADELLSGTDDEPSALDEAVGWLQSYLSHHGRGGEAESKDVKADARKANISDATLKRALKDAGITVRNEGFPRKTLWSIDPNAAKKIARGPSRLTPEDEPTGATIVQFPQVGHSGAVGSSPVGSNPPDPTDKQGQNAHDGWSQETIGAAENEHEE